MRTSTVPRTGLDRRPTAVVRAGSVRDVVAAFDAALGLRVAPQGTGR